MSTITTSPPRPVCHNVGMGQIVIARGTERLTTVLGSCIGLALVLPRQHVAVLAHIVLPESLGRAGTPGKFADTALPHMLELLKAERLSSETLVAKYAGGSNMLATGGPLQIGEANQAIVQKLLAALKIRVSSVHLGGGKGRKVTVDCQTGNMTVEVAGATQVIL